MLNQQPKRMIFTLGGFWAFFGFGFVDNVKGPLLPEMVRSGRFDYAQASSLIFASYIGFIVATLGSGALADRLSNRVVLFMAGWCVLLGLGGMTVATSMFALIACMTVLGLGLGAIELGANGLMIELHSENRGRYLNLLSVFHGCGSLIVPLAAAQLIDAQWTWQSIYAMCASLALPLVFVFWPTRFSRKQASPDQTIPEKAVPEPAVLEPAGQSIGSQGAGAQPGTASSPAAANWLASGFSPVMWCYYLLIATYVATELSIAQWMMEYLQQQNGFSVDKSSRYLSAFFVMLMMGRLVGAWVVERTHYLLAVAVALVATGLCIGTALLIDQRLVFLLPVSGVCMSIIFPTVTASVSRLHPQNSGKIIGLLFAFSGLGGALGPWIVGLISQTYGLHSGICTTLIFNGVSVAALLLLPLARSIQPLPSHG